MSTVAVTGAGGFIGSWIVRILLDRGYQVRAAVRDPHDELKLAHLKQLPGAPDRLTTVKLDLSSSSAIEASVQGCDGVFHVACAMAAKLTRDPHAEIVQPIVDGTVNLMRACSSAGVTRVVLTSTIGTMYLDPSRGDSAPIDEQCWSSLEFMEETGEWYCLGKTLAESAAWQISRKSELDLVVINPCVTLGPVLQPWQNASSSHILRLINTKFERYLNRSQAYVDVRDVALAHVEAFERQGARGRYLCAESSLHRAELIDVLREVVPPEVAARLPSKMVTGGERAARFVISTEKIRRELGLKFRPLKECLKDSVESYRDKGLLVFPRASPALA
ncbi:hypothetical protein SELMODRAFT_123171 [Selaginella moellendorffii]|uniref:NAD-dependent epimerase/dehydratase domain-containing protein n=1 Tax=Selaginella moellendorffii TaxID=88036 RepID=D8SRF7_SELML|nr:cinnamoyl-CoA reductase 1 [Selaginella moellendorffii]EFJ13136.1 hypothetical protein SELMODRAFT_123171 [Selaginella moellendorffii]|eukprot:XP_002985959.1 cinnamoyl-CoA reductase 1 [Selaginella moellendorffii]